MRSLTVAPEDAVVIGARLRAARKARGYTLDQVAQATGLTKGFLSRVERNETSPSVSTLVSICQVMSIDVGSLFSATETGVVRRDDRPAINLGGTGVTETLLSPRGQAGVQLVDSVVDPLGTSGEDLYTVNCELECVHVLSGLLEVTFPDRVERLRTGDTLTFAGDAPHRWINPSRHRGAHVQWVIIPAPWSS